MLKVAVNHIYSQEQRLSFELELEMNLNYPIDEDAAHSLRDLWLYIHILHLGLIVHFGFDEVLHNVFGELSHVLDIMSIFFITLLNRVYEMLLAPLFELIVNRLQFLFKSDGFLPFIIFLVLFKILSLSFFSGLIISNIPLFSIYLRLFDTRLCST